MPNVALCPSTQAIKPRHVFQAAAVVEQLSLQRLFFVCAGCFFIGRHYQPETSFVRRINEIRIKRASLNSFSQTFLHFFPPHPPRFELFDDTDSLHQVFFPSVAHVHL